MPRMKRMTIQIPAKADEVLDRLSGLDQTTKADVLRRALAVYDYLHREAIEKNGKVRITDQNDQVQRELVFP